MRSTVRGVVSRAPLLLAVLTFSLAAGVCQPLQAKGRAEGAASESKVTIRVLGRWSDETAFSKARRQLIEEWAQAHPECEVVDESVSQEDIYGDKFKTAVAVGSVPDVVSNHGSGNLRPYVENKVFVDLEPVLLADDGWSRAFLPGSFDNWRFAGIPGTYGIPHEVSAVGLFYDADMFAQAGLEPPETIEQLEQACERLLARGTLPMALGGKDGWRVADLFSCLSTKYSGSARALDLASRRGRWTDPETVSALSIIDHWNRRKYFGPSPLAMDYQAEKSLFLRGGTAMHLDSNVLLGEIGGSDRAGSIGFIPFPYFAGKPEHRSEWLGGGAAALSVSSPPGARRDVAIDLVKWFTSPDAFQRISDATGGGIFPVAVKLDPALMPRAGRQLLDALASAGPMRTNVAYYDALAQVNEKVRSELQGILAGNSPAGAARAIQALIDSSAPPLTAGRQ